MNDIPQVYIGRSYQECLILLHTKGIPVRVERDIILSTNSADSAFRLQGYVLDPTQVHLVEGYNQGTFWTPPSIRDSLVTRLRKGTKSISDCDLIYEN